MAGGSDYKGFQTDTCHGACMGACPICGAMPEINFHPAPTGEPWQPKDESVDTTNNSAG